MDGSVRVPVPFGSRTNSKWKWSSPIPLQWAAQSPSADSLMDTGIKKYTFYIDKFINISFYRLLYFKNVLTMYVLFTTVIANNNKKALMTLKQRICWRTHVLSCHRNMPADVNEANYIVPFTKCISKGYIMTHMPCSLQSRHCKGDRDDHLLLEFVREPNGADTRTDPSLC